MTESRGAVVANPGHIPWMAHTAAAFARAGALGQYLDPVGLLPSTIERVEGLLPPAVAPRVVAELRRRQLPSAAEGAAVRHPAAFFETAAIVSKRFRVSHRLERAIADLRDVRFDAACARLLDRRRLAVFCSYGAAAATLRRSASLGVPTFLDYPVGHHAFAERLLQEELALRPDYASTMQFHRVPPRRRRRLERELQEATAIVALSGFHRRTFVDEGVAPEKVLVNPFGVDLQQFRPVSQEQPRPFRVLFVGQLTQRKGLSYAVDGFRRTGLAESELLLAGRLVGGRRPWPDDHQIRHIDMVAPSDAPTLYAQADVVVLPSLIEGLARVILEAMASGLPVIATPNTGAEEVMRDGEHGFVVPIRDADAIAACLVRLAEDPAGRRAMGLAARQQAERYTWEAYGERMVEFALTSPPS